MVTHNILICSSIARLAQAFFLFFFIQHEHNIILFLLFMFIKICVPKMMENVNALASRHRHAHNNANMMDEMDLFDGRTKLRNKQGNVTIMVMP